MARKPTRSFEFATRMADMGGTLVRLGKGLRSVGYEFTTTTPASHTRVNARPENKAAKDLRDVFGWSRPFTRDLLPADLVALMHDAGILLEENGMLRSALRVSSLDPELFFHSAFPTTEADAVFFGPDTYRFARAIQASLKERIAPIRNAIDIGCGAGPGGILVAKHAPEARVLMTDINEAALRLARVMPHSPARQTRSRSVATSCRTSTARSTSLCQTRPISTTHVSAPIATAAAHS